MQAEPYTAQHEDKWIALDDAQSTTDLPHNLRVLTDHGWRKVFNLVRVFIARISL